MKVRVVKASKRVQKQKPPRVPSTVTPSRLTAFEILRRIEEDGSFSSTLLAIGTHELSSVDRGLCYELVLGTLRWQLWLDSLIEHYAKRKIEELDRPVRRALRLGLYQLRFLSKIPESAAVNESVNLAHHYRLSSAAGFINAVLRNSIRKPDYDPVSNVDDPIERLSIKTSHPRWLIERWVAAFGMDEATSFAEANNEAAHISFRVNLLHKEANTVIEELERAGIHLVPSALTPNAWRIEGENHSLLYKMVNDGRIYMQDEASQLVAYIMGASAGERILDLCAAPGSKTTQLAMMAEDRASIVAGDLYDYRLNRTSELIKQQQLKSISLVRLNAEMVLPFKEESFDKVLVDAPCTGTGTFRHNPEIRWRIKPEDITDLSRRQQTILSNGARMVRPGGLLVYSTCSVEREENEEVTASFLAHHKEFVPAPEQLPSRLQSDSGSLRTWPHREDVDGFYAMVMRRV
jgi:16S rRNA (cytosine967-C5)-methyltransferase